jgi:hypothetical protein
LRQARFKNRWREDGVERAGVVGSVDGGQEGVEGDFITYCNGNMKVIIAFAIVN